MTRFYDYLVAAVAQKLQAIAEKRRNGKLVYSLGPVPNTHWGSNLADAPPSYNSQDILHSEK
jgi:hypothetical protein